ncbi:MAG: hypothetical protein RL154_359 [Pseudomonadota bacterium]
MHKLENFRHLNILYAEDDLKIATNTIKTLELFFDNIIFVTNGADALKEFKKQKVHIVILDYVMPILDGASVAGEIRKSDKKTPIFITSAHIDSEKLLKSISLNLIDYLEKPVSLNVLKATLYKSIDSIIENGLLESELSDGIYYNFFDKNIINNLEVIKLTKNEYLFMEMLLNRRGNIIMNEEIEDIIFGGAIEQNALRNMVYRLRKKIKNSNVILTSKDIGYFIK